MDLEYILTYGTSESVSSFSIIKSSMPIVTSGALEQLETTEDTTEETAEETTEITEELVTSESKIPSWVHDIFVWYANETISETELLISFRIFNFSRNN